MLKWHIADRRVPSNDPSYRFGTNFGSVLFCFLKWPIDCVCVYLTLNQKVRKEVLLCFMKEINY